LVSLETIAENSFIKQEAEPGSGLDWWIGGTDLGSNGTFHWVTGTVFWQNGSAVGYANFLPGQPDLGKNEHCLVLTEESGFAGWHVEDCSFDRNFVCEGVPSCPGW
jgi:hypothetical protein